MKSLRLQKTNATLKAQNASQGGVLSLTREDEKMNDLERLAKTLKNSTLLPAEKLVIMQRRASLLGYDFRSVLNVSEILFTQWVTGKASIPAWIAPALSTLSGGWITEAEIVENQKLPERREKITDKAGRQTLAPIADARVLGLEHADGVQRTGPQVGRPKTAKATETAKAPAPASPAPCDDDFDLSCLL